MNALHKSVASLLVVLAFLTPARSNPPSPDDDEPAVARAKQHSLLMQSAGVGSAAGTDARARAPLAPLSLQNFDAAIDATWGAGLPTARKLEIFDLFWQTTDAYFGAFQGIEDVDWKALRDSHRPQVAAGVSRGRFAAIMNHMSLALRESHTQAMDREVNFDTLPQPGVPLLWIGPWFRNTFGACTTALDDGSALIIQVAPGHPLGLAPGDRVLGFDGRAWTDLYPELLAAELPLYPLFWGASPSSYRNTFVASGPLNWHLFDTIDVVKHGTGDVQHLSTALLQNGPASPFCTEQMDVAGIAKPQFEQTNFENVVSWGLLPGSRIGYIYVWGWFGDAGPAFAQAVDELTQQQQTDGLIIDFRFNLGGNMFLSEDGLGMIFAQPVPTIGFAARSDPRDHFKMRMSTPPAVYVIDMFDGKYDTRSYDRPIAVLAGPGALSSGDQVALRMTYYPHVRIFGRSTATAFNAPAVLDLDPDWFTRLAFADSFRVEAPKDYLTHDEFHVDEPVWLTPDDVAAGRDTVVEAARAWIASQ